MNYYTGIFLCASQFVSCGFFFLKKRNRNKITVSLFRTDHIPGGHDVLHHRLVPDPNREVPVWLPNTEIVAHRNVTIVHVIADVPIHVENRRKKNVIPAKDPIQKSILNHLLMIVIKVSISIQLIHRMHSIRNQIV